MYRGTVLAVIHEQDGDYHLWVKPDARYGALLNSSNVYHGTPALVLEIVPECINTPPDSTTASECPPSKITPPKVGDHVEVSGPWVLDTVHGWNELHPVTALRVL
jgi:hypothetical protein